MSWESEQIRIGKVLDGPVKVWENDHNTKETKTHIATPRKRVAKSERKTNDGGRH